MIVSRTRQRDAERVKEPREIRARAKVFSKHDLGAEFKQLLKKQLSEPLRDADRVADKVTK
jgi:hypothetical protein